MPRKTEKKTKELQASRLALRPPGAARQVRFYQLLVAARKQWFIDALSEALGLLDQRLIKQQIGEYVPQDVQRLIAAAGLRDEYLFPVPAVIEIKPSLVGYYRLLLGVSQKSFYKGGTGMSRFKNMEEMGTISSGARVQIPEFCRSMAEAISELVRQIPALTERDLRELPLLTYGSQLQGSNNTQIGKTAMNDVFMAVRETVSRYVVDSDTKTLTLKNSTGRIVVITLSHDPDVQIHEVVGKEKHFRVAIEVKGGTDHSNAHNRAGEAEKSHQKARKHGFTEFWTIISTQGLDLSKLRAESPTTNRWFDVAQVLARTGPDWEDFRQRLSAACAIPIKRK